VSTDNSDPYHVYGGLQDNSSWVGDSSYPGGVTNSRWENMYGGDGFWMFEDTADPDYIYAEAQGGEIGRVNRKTHEARFIKPLPNYGEKKLRFNWNTPIHMSPNEKGTLYIGAQFLFRSRDHGQTWERISPDLTTNDPEKQKQEESGGITVDNSSAEMHTTIYSISESPKNGQVIWVGTDDGNIQITRDGAKTWTNVIGNVPDLEKNSWVSTIEASRFDEFGEHLSMSERRAIAAERCAMDRYVAAYMAQHVGATFPGRISGVTRFGLFVNLDGTGADGLIPIRNIGQEFFRHDEGRQLLIGERSGETYGLGDRLKVKLADADAATGGLLFDIVEVIERVERQALPRGRGRPAPRPSAAPRDKRSRRRR